MKKTAAIAIVASARVGEAADERIGAPAPAIAKKACAAAHVEVPVGPVADAIAERGAGFDPPGLGHASVTIAEPTARFRYLAVAVTEGVVALACLASAIVLWPAAARSSEPAVAELAGCDLGAPGAAQVTYAITNRDRAEHSYKIDITVASGSRVLGSGSSLINRIEPGAKVTGRVGGSPKDAARVTVSGGAEG